MGFLEVMTAVTRGALMMTSGPETSQLLTLGKQAMPIIFKLSSPVPKPLVPNPLCPTPTFPPKIFQVDSKRKGMRYTMFNGNNINLTC